jgi:hypothetical protein
MSASDMTHPIIVMAYLLRDYNRANDGVSFTYLEVLNINPHQIKGYCCSEIGKNHCGSPCVLPERPLPHRFLCGCTKF